MKLPFYIQNHFFLLNQSKCLKCFKVRATVCLCWIITIENKKKKKSQVIKIFMILFLEMFNLYFPCKYQVSLLEIFFMESNYPNTKDGLKLTKKETKLDHNIALELIK